MEQCIYYIQYFMTNKYFPNIDDFFFFSVLKGNHRSIVTASNIKVIVFFPCSRNLSLTLFAWTVCTFNYPKVPSLKLIKVMLIV